MQIFEAEEHLKAHILYVSCSEDYVRVFDQIFEIRFHKVENKLNVCAPAENVAQLQAKRTQTAIVWQTIRLLLLYYHAELLEEV